MWRLLIISVLLHGTLCLAQRDSSLTQDFARLSAKERTRIAAKEQDEALKDAEFQRLMAEGERLFQLKRYDDALSEYKLARARRPYNVYPKVKIQDLEALIAKRDAESLPEPVVAAPGPAVITEPVINSKAPPVPDPSVVTASVPAREPVPVPVDVSPSVVPAPPPATIRKVDPAPSRPKAARNTQKETPIKPVREIDTGHDHPMQERIFKEGRSVVVERVIAIEGRPVIFRKVTQPWGDVNYFREGIPISSEGWSSIFSDV
jgi:hypothetical protein